MKTTYLVAEGASREGDGFAFTVVGGLRVEGDQEVEREENNLALNVIC